MNPKNTGRIQGIAGGVMTGAVALAFVLQNYRQPVGLIRPGEVVFVEDATTGRQVSGVIVEIVDTREPPFDGTLLRMGIVIDGVWVDDAGAVTFAPGTPLQLYDLAGGASVDARVEWVAADSDRASVSVVDAAWQQNNEWLPDLERLARVRGDVDKLVECMEEVASASTPPGS